jgi:hypothetical protein
MTTRRPDFHLRAEPARETASLPTRSNEHPAVDDLSPRPAESELPPPHLTPAEAAIWTAAERARRCGDPTTYWRLRRALLLCQACRYEGELP